MRRLLTVGLLVVVTGFILVSGIAHAVEVPYCTDDPNIPGNECLLTDPNTTSVAGASTTDATAAQDLAFTGSNQTSLYVAVGTVLLLVGTAALIVTARRRRSEIGLGIDP
jgi:LPXTG-motif cell wall-anchored protein